MKILEYTEDIYPKIKKDEKIKNVLNTLYKARVDRVIVLKNGGSLYGIATEWDIFFKLSMMKKERYQPYNLSLSSVTTYPVDTLDPTADIKSAIQLFMIKGYSSIPIIEEENKIYGLVTKRSVINHYLDDLSKLELKSEDIMRRVKGRVEPFNSLKNVENKMRLGGFNTLVVHSNGKYLGVVSSLDLAKALFQIRKLHPTKEWSRYIERLTVIDIMRRDVETVKPDDKVFKAAKLLASGKQKVVPVVNEEEKIIGIITRRPVLEVIQQKIL